MPIIKSAIKRARQSAKRRQHNLVVKSAIKKDIKSLLTAIESKDQKSTETNLRAAISEIDRAVKKGTLHKNTAGHRKSKLTKLANQVVGSPTKSKPAQKAKAAKPKAAAKKPASKKAKKS